MIEDEVLRVERRLGVALAVWGAGSTAVGGLLSWRGKNAATRAFGRQTAGWGFVDGVKTSSEGYIAPSIVAFLNLLVLVIGWDDLYKI